MFTYPVLLDPDPNPVPAGGAPQFQIPAGHHLVRDDVYDERTRLVEQGRGSQALYKRFADAGIDPNTLSDPMLQLMAKSAGHSQYSPETLMNELFAEPAAQPAPAAGAQPAPGMSKDEVLQLIEERSQRDAAMGQANQVHSTGMAEQHRLMAALSKELGIPDEIKDDDDRNWFIKNALSGALVDQMGQHGRYGEEHLLKDQYMPLGESHFKSMSERVQRATGLFSAQGQIDGANAIVGSPPTGGGQPPGEPDPNATNTDEPRNFQDLQDRQNEYLAQQVDQGSQAGQPISAAAG